MKKSRFWGLAGRARRLIIILSALMGLAGPILIAAPAALAAPRVAVAETSRDFGKVFENQAMGHTFVIKNEGDAPLQVEDVDPDCACTVADYDRVIPPGGQGKLTLTIKPYSVMRNFLKKTKVQFNDPARPELVLIMKGYVQPIIEIQPSHIIRLRGKVDDDLRSQVRFISHLSGPWEIKKFDNSLPQMMEVSLKTEEPGKVYVLEVRNIRRESGQYAGKIELFTSSRERPRLIIRVFANLYPSGAGTP